MAVEDNLTKEIRELNTKAHNLLIEIERLEREYVTTTRRIDELKKASNK